MAISVSGYLGRCLAPNCVRSVRQSGSIGFDTISGVNWSIAQTFTTGGNTAGYTLSAVDVKLASGTHSANTRVSIYNTSGSPPAPSTSLYVLTNPSSLSASATNTFSADAGASLLANTTYAVVFEVTSGTATTSLDRTDSDAEDSGAASGWSIANKRHSRQGTGSWTEATATEKPMIAIKGKSITGMTTPAVSIAGGPAVSEGGSAAFTVSASPAPASNLTVNLTISQTGSLVASGGLGSKMVTVPASGSATYSVATVDDSTDETNGSVTATLATGMGYTLHATNTSASVTVNDNDGPPQEPDPGQPPTDPSGGTEQPPRDPQPLQLALWTDAPGYRSGDTVRLYRSLDYDHAVQLDPDSAAAVAAG